MTIRVIHGDCLVELPKLAEEIFHAVVVDPPYHLTQNSRGGSARTNDPETPFGRTRLGGDKGFMGKTWDGGNVAFRVGTWEAVYRVMKPGAHLVAFGGTRTSHRMVCAIEDAGFEIRDTLAWLYGSGFPKSHDVSKAIDKAVGARREIIGRRTDGPSSWMLDQKLEHRANGGTGLGYADGSGKEYDVTAPATSQAQAWSGWGSALKPAFEPIILARKPLDGTIAENVLKHGCGALNIDASRVALGDGEVQMDRVDEPSQESRYDLEGATDFAAKPGRRIGAPGWGGPMKRLSVVPGQDGVLVPRTPPVAGGRWPANVVHDGSKDVLAAFPEAPGQQRFVGTKHGDRNSVNCYGDYGPRPDTPPRGDSGSAARFFYTAKADKADRADSKHPTVKPVDLMRWLVTLVCPAGGHVLDCFAGSGTTGEACMLAGLDCTLIEREAQHARDIEHRIKRWSGLDAPLFAT